MKKIEAFIKPERLPQVMLALHHIEGLGGMTAVQGQGFGRGHEPNDFEDPVSDMTAVVRLEVFCTDDQVDPIVAAIENAAHTGLRGDGKVYVLPVEQAVRISTRQRGQAAI